MEAESRSKDERMEKIAALLPAYNEEKHLGGILDELKEYISDIIVVDDGSKDHTKQIAEEKGVMVLSRGYNMGVGQTIKDGLTWAMEQGFDAVVMLDADGQHLPSEINRFIQDYRTNRHHLVIGYRDYRKIPLRRRIPNTIGKFFLSWAVGTNLPDNQSGYRLVDREFIPIILNSNEKGFNFMVEMITFCVAQGWKIGWVPISTVYSDEKSHQKAWYQITGFTRMCVQARKTIRRAKQKDN